MRHRRTTAVIASIAAAALLCAAADARPPFRPVKRKVVAPAPIAESAPPGQSGAAASPSRPFSMYWCVTGRNRTDVDPSPFPFIRRDVVIFYQQHFGLYPRYYLKQHENYGGIPQRVNMPGHLADVRQEVLAAIPDPNWTGFAVIDYEEWNLHWSILDEFYKQKSREHVRARFPSFSADQVEARAAEEWNESAKQLFLQTIELCKTLRPQAKWGFYGMPWYHGNDQRLTPWLMDACTAMYPSVYAFDYGVPDGATRTRGQAPLSKFRQFVETSVINARALGGDKPVMCFVWARYIDRHPEYNEKLLNPDDLRIMIDLPRELGADGLIIWDNFNDAAHAAESKAYFLSRMAPELERTMNLAGAGAAAQQAPGAPARKPPVRRAVTPRR